MRRPTRLQGAAVAATAVLAWGAFWAGYGYSRPTVLTIQPEPTAATHATRAPERHTATNTHRPVSVDPTATTAPHRRSQP